MQFKGIFLMFFFKYEIKKKKENLHNYVLLLSNSRKFVQNAWSFSKLMIQLWQLHIHTR